MLPPPTAAAIAMGGIGAYFIGIVAIFRGIKMRAGRRLGFTRRQSRRLKLDSPARFDASVQRIRDKAPGSEHLATPSSRSCRSGRSVRIPGDAGGVGLGIDVHDFFGGAEGCE